MRSLLPVHIPRSIRRCRHFGLLAALFGVLITTGTFDSVASAHPAAHTTPGETSAYGSGGLMAADPEGGYWTVTSTGIIASHGGAPVFGSPALSGLVLAQPIVGLAATPDGQGYWLVAADGGIFTFGDATFFGSTGAIHLNQPIVGLAATPDGRGYWLVAADGGIFTFGDATFFGSTGSLRLNQPIVGLAATPDGRGYWLVASDGGIFTFGDATFFGSTGAIHLNQPIVGLAATPDGQGYWLVAADGGIFTFGDATFHGSLGASRADVIGMIVVPPAADYVLVESDGNVETPTTGAGPAFGLSVPTLVNESASQQAAALSDMRSIGVRWVRVDANWSWVQPNGPSSFDWSLIDQEVNSMTAADMHIDLIIDDTPAWARNSDAPGNWGQPASASAFATFAAEVAARYEPKGVLTYEIWNEPNIQTFWTPAPNPTLYTAMLRDSYTAIKAAEPNVTVLSGGLAPATDDGTNIAPITFLTDMYADGAKGSFDALGYHAYSAPTLPDTYSPSSGWSQMNQTSPSLRSVMTANGDGGKQIWITEVGAPSAGPMGVGTTGQAQEVTEATQGAKSTPWIGAEFFYTYEDAATNPDFYGLRNADGSPKPAWTALAAALS
jgi:hypothetical protein